MRHEAEIREARVVEMTRIERYDAVEKIPASSWTGPVITARWVDQERQKGIRSRIAMRDYKGGSGSDESLFAGTPDGAMLFVLAHLLASDPKLCVVVVDVESAFLHPRLSDDEALVIKPPRDLQEPGVLWRLKVPLYGWRKASAKYQDHQAEIFEEDGWERSAVESCGWRSSARQCRALVHGDDTICIAYEENCKQFVKFMKENFVCSDSGIAGAVPNLAKEVRFTKREVRCDPALGWEDEPDSKHMGWILERLNLARDDAKVALTSGTHEADKLAAEHDEKENPNLDKRE